jgi:hypothetical protein
MRGRIDELSRQLSHANDELRELRTAFGKVTSYNEILVHENEGLQEEIKELKSARKESIRKGKRRQDDDDETEGRQTKWPRGVAHSSDEGDESEDDDEAARVRLKFSYSTYLILIILTDFLI